MNYYESFFSYQECGEDETKWGRGEVREENLALSTLKCKPFEDKYFLHCLIEDQ